MVFVIVRLMVTFAAVIDLGAVMLTNENGAAVNVAELGLTSICINTLTLTWLLQCHPIQNQ